MSDLVDPDTFEENHAANDPDTPSFRFSQFFVETHTNVAPKLAGAWLKVLDKDTLLDFCETFMAIDKSGADDNIGPNDFTRKDLADLIYLTMLVWQWETGRTWNVSLTDEDVHHRHIEYLYRFAQLVQFEYMQRLGMKSPDEVLERDDAQHHGKLSIFE